jgi:MGT family glycosyltransferase
VTPLSVVVFAMSERGHFMRLKPLIAGLAAEGVATHVFTDVQFRDDVERLGGRFVDLFAGRPLSSIDGSSIPIPSRFVSFAGHCGDAVAAEAAALRPALVIHDTFAIIGRVVANRLGLPRVNVCAGHNVVAEQMIEALHHDPRVRISDVCDRAAALLKTNFGIDDASPFSYVSGTSSDLNLYCEPPQFLPPSARGPFEPVEFFGSLALEHRYAPALDASPFGDTRGEHTRIYVSFGTIVWRYYEAAALSALGAIADAFAGQSTVSVLASLGGVGDPQRAAACAAPNIRIEYYVDQQRVLRDASLYITHQGLNSTHEAIYHGVPMVSYPFFWDQPALAARCQALGLAVPLADTPRGPLTREMVTSAVARVAVDEVPMRERLAKARRWEIETIARRPAVVRRIIDLALGAS